MKRKAAAAGLSRNQRIEQAKKRQFMRQMGFNPTTTFGPALGRGFNAPRQAPAAFTQSGSEIKAIDLAVATYNFSLPATNSMVLLNGVQTGAGFFNRVGSRIEMKNLHIRGLIKNLATAIQDQGRLIIVYDRQPTGALPTIADLLQSRDQTGAATNPGTAEINLDNRDRFAILRDASFYFPSVTFTGGVQTNGPAYPGTDDELDVNIFIKLKGLASHYKSSSNPCTIADIATGALYACFVSVNETAKYSFVGSFRLRYDDK